MKRRIFTTLDNLAKRDIFDAKYAQLEKEEKTLTSKSGARSEKRRSCLQKKTSSSLPPRQRSTQRNRQKSGIRRKVSLRCRRPCKNEFLGWLTIFSFHRSHKVKTTRFVRYDDDDKRLYLDFYERKDRDRNKKRAFSSIFTAEVG